MKIRFIKAWREFAENAERSVLAVTALVTGIAGLGTILVSWSILTHDLNANYEQTKPAHLILKSENFNRLDLTGFSQWPEIESAEFRDFSLHRIEIKPDVWIPLWLFASDNFSKASTARIFHEHGLKEPAAGSLLIERDGLKVSDIGIGKPCRIRTGNITRVVSVSGICFDPAQAPATQDAFIYAYTGNQTYKNLTGLPVYQRLIIRLKNVYKTEDVAVISEKLVQRLKASGIDNIAVQIPEFNTHPHQWQLNTLLFLIGSIGMLAFIMGAVLVSQLMRSVLAGQIRQIGIMKAIGGSRFQIFQIYLMLLLIYGGIAGLIAVPLAAAAGKSFSGFVAKTLNFNIITTTIPFYIYLILATLSLMLPLLLSFSVLLKGTSIRVRDAISDYGINTETSTTLYFRWLRKLRLPEVFILAFRNSFRNSSRLTVTILSTALGVAIFSTGFNVRQSLWELLSGVKDEMKYDVQVVLNRQVKSETALAPFLKTGNVRGTETWLGGRGEIQSKLLSTDKGAGITALPYNTDYLKLRITEGRWISKNTFPEIVMNQKAWELYNKPVLESVIEIVSGSDKIKARITGIAEEFDKAKIYMDMEAYNIHFHRPELINTIVFAAKDNDYDKVTDLKKNIEKAIISSDLDVLYVMSHSERVKIIYDHLNIILTVILLLSFLVLLVSATGMASATGINIRERTREIGIMRATGATPRHIYRIFVTESMIISAISILLGLIISFPLSRIAASFFGNLILGAGTNLKFAFSPAGFAITVLVTIFFSWLAGRIPARIAVRISTREALSYE